MMANNGHHHLNMHQHQLHHSAVHHLSPHLQHQQNQHLQQAHVQQQQLHQHNQLIAQQQSIQHQLNNQAAHNVAQHQHNLTPTNAHFTSAMMSNSNAANAAAILLPPSPYGSDKSGDLSPNQTTYLDQHTNNLHNEQILNNSTSQQQQQQQQQQQHNHRQHNNLQQLHYSSRTSPQSSPSSVINLHSPTNSTNLIQNLNGIPVSPAVSPVHCCDDDNEQQQQQAYNTQQHLNLAHQQHSLAHHPHLSFAGNANSLNERQLNQGQNNNNVSLGGSLLSKLTSQPITVLQHSANAGVITQNNQQAALRIASSNSSVNSCTNSNLISNLASAIVSTPVAVVSSAHQQQQLAIDCKTKLHNNSSNNNQVGSSTNLHLASPNGRSNSATSTADEGEEINTKELAQRISAGLFLFFFIFLFLFFFIFLFFYFFIFLFFYFFKFYFIF